MDVTNTYGEQPHESCKEEEDGGRTVQVCFYSVTYPKKAPVEVMTVKGPSGKTTCKNRTKYELIVMYKQLKVGSIDKFVVKKKKICIGMSHSTDECEGDSGTVKPAVATRAKKRTDYLRVESPAFDEKRVRELGGFLSDKFWAANIFWGDGGSLGENLQRTVDAVHERLQSQVIKAVPPTKPCGVLPANFAKQSVKKEEEEGVTPVDKAI